MSPQLIQSLRNNSHAHPVADSVTDNPFRLSGDDARSILMNAGTVMTYIPEGIRPRPSSDDFDDDRVLEYSLHGDTIMEDDEHPPSTQPRPPNWGVFPFPEFRPATPLEEHSMEQFISFVYRGNAVSAVIIE